MRSGIKAEDTVLGTGDEAVRGKTVVVNVHTFLKLGTEIESLDPSAPRMVIDLKRRECIAGLRYGIEGMRVGGKRVLIISPHLAYGDHGIPGRIPPKAVIRCEVELLEVREHGVRGPEDFPPGRHLCVFCPGIAVRNQPRWQFGMNESGQCGLILTYPNPGMPWRHVRYARKEMTLDISTALSLFDEVNTIRANFPQDFFKHEELWADHTEKGNAITRHRGTDVVCLTISISERGQYISWNIAETSRALKESPLFAHIQTMLRIEGINLPQ